MGQLVTLTKNAVLGWAINTGAYAQQIPTKPTLTGRKLELQRAIVNDSTFIRATEKGMVYTTAWFYLLNGQWKQLSRDVSTRVELYAWLHGDKQEAIIAVQE